MKKLFRYMTLVGIMAMLTGTLAGCGDSENTEEAAETGKPAIAYAIADTANAKPVDLNAPVISDTLTDCAKAYGYAFVVRVDGDPELVIAEDLDIDEQYKSASEQRLKIDAQNKASNILSEMGEVKAVNSEVDFLEAIRKCAASLQSLDESYTSRTIICCGTGLGTTGYVNFQNNLISASPDTVVEMLDEREALPDLEGITLYWIGMGQVEEPQENLTPKQLNNLEAIWKAVVEASGGEFISNDYVSVENTDAVQSENLPEVTSIDLPDEQPMVYDAEALETGDNAFENPVILGDDQIKFEGDKAEYVDEDEARETLRPIAEYLAEHTSVNLLLIGSTAGDVNNDSDIVLSKERAEAVKTTLTDDLGVSGDRLTAVGLGCDDPWHIMNVGTDSKLAASNRKVVLLDDSTDQAKTILAGL